MKTLTNKQCDKKQRKNKKKKTKKRRFCLFIFVFKNEDNLKRANTSNITQSNIIIAFMYKAKEKTNISPAPSENSISTIKPFI